MNFIERDRAIMKIADTFGPKNQRLKLIEELSEILAILFIKQGLTPEVVRLSQVIDELISQEMK